MRDWVLSSVVCGFVGNLFLLFVGAWFCCFLLALFRLGHIRCNRPTSCFSNNLFPNSGWLPTSGSAASNKKTPPLFRLQILKGHSPYMLCFFRAAIRITEKVGHSLLCLVWVNKDKYFCMPFGVLLVFRTQVCFSHAREFSICTCFFFQKKGSEKK